DGNREAVAALINAGCVTGTSDTTLDSSSNITRAQMAVLMNNVVNYVD
ncbi:MAG: S-layer homology domain-containing protein, partial [Clostridia bacterium]|nr:S-layer homology domain-containing protein [Clostridia bacterium]